MSAERDNNLPKETTSSTRTRIIQGPLGVFGSSLITEEVISSKASDDKQPEKPHSNWESRKAMALRIGARGIKNVASTIRGIIIPEEYSVFKLKKPLK